MQKASPGAPFSAATEEGGGAAKREQDLGGAGWAGKREQRPREASGAPSTPPSSIGYRAYYVLHSIWGW